MIETRKAKTESNFDQKVVGVLSDLLEKICLAWRKALSSDCKEKSTGRKTEMIGLVLSLG